jgi:hypothetical protein
MKALMKLPETAESTGPVMAWGWNSVDRRARKCLDVSPLSGAERVPGFPPTPLPVFWRLLGQELAYSRPLCSVNPSDRARPACIPMSEEAIMLSLLQSAAEAQPAGAREASLILPDLGSEQFSDERQPAFVRAGCLGGLHSA